MTKKAEKPKLVPTARRVTVSLQTLADEVDALTKFATLASLKVGDVTVTYAEGRVVVEKGQVQRVEMWGFAPNADFQRASFDVGPPPFGDED